MDWFRKPKLTFKPESRKGIPEGLFVKCPGCMKVLHVSDIERNLKVCPKPNCSYHFRVGAHDRIRILVDDDTFQEHDENLQSCDPLHFTVNNTSYQEKLQKYQESTGLGEAIVTGFGKMDGVSATLAVTDSSFLMGSMGSAVGEKFTRIVEAAIESHTPVVSVSGSGGGARMYEGMLSLLQMAKVNAALARLSDAALPHVSIITDPTMGGVAASFASVGDVVIAEPGAVLGFAGPRVIRETIGSELPNGFQTAEFQLKHGIIDMIVHRAELKQTVVTILRHLTS